MPEMIPPLVSLYAFVLVAETGSLTAAAERLNVTQPAISKRIRVLEAELGVALLQRGANATQLTDAGRLLAISLTEGFAKIRQATESLPRMPRGPLRIRTHNTWAVRWLIPRLGRFRKLYPEHEVVVTTSLNPVDFAREGIDVAIISNERRPGPAAERLQPLYIAPYAAPRIAESVHRLGLAGATLLGSHARPQDWSLWVLRNKLGITAAPLLFESTMLAVQAALEGLGAVIVSPNLVTEDVRQQRLVPLSREPIETGSHFWLLLPPGAVRPGASNFRAWLLEEIKLEADSGSAEQIYT
jgi:LysR family glycine cleavage system transcriptional activator